jgi:hypothetical protein
MISPAVVPEPRLCGAPGSARSDWCERIVDGLAPRTFFSHYRYPHASYRPSLIAMLDKAKLAPAPPT